MDYERFKETPYLIYNRHNIGFRIIFDNFERENGITKFTCSVLSCKDKNRWLEHCFCDESEEEGHNLDDNEICINSYTHLEYIMKDSFEECMKETINYIDKHHRCIQCECLHMKYKKHRICGQCIIQDILDRKSKSFGECVCCSETIYQRNKVTLKCKHTFHKKCIKKITNNKCPLCRSNITLLQLPTSVPDTPVNSFTSVTPINTSNLTYGTNASPRVSNYNSSSSSNSNSLQTNSIINGARIPVNIDTILSGSSVNSNTIDPTTPVSVSVTPRNLLSSFNSTSLPSLRTHISTISRINTPITSNLGPLEDDDSDTQIVSD